jgi:hypothetical protein
VDVSGPEGAFPMEYLQRSCVRQLAAEKALSRLASFKKPVSPIGDFIISDTQLSRVFKISCPVPSPSSTILQDGWVEIE